MALNPKYVGLDMILLLASFAASCGLTFFMDQAWNNGELCSAVGPSASVNGAGLVVLPIAGPFIGAYFTVQTFRNISRHERLIGEKLAAMRQNSSYYENYYGNNQIQIELLHGTLCAAIAEREQPKQQALRLESNSCIPEELKQLRKAKTELEAFFPEVKV